MRCVWRVAAGQRVGGLLRVSLRAVLLRGVPPLCVGVGSLPLVLRRRGHAAAAAHAGHRPRGRRPRGGGAALRVRLGLGRAGRVRNAALPRRAGGRPAARRADPRERRRLRPRDRRRLAARPAARGGRQRIRGRHLPRSDLVDLRRGRRQAAGRRLRCRLAPHRGAWRRGCRTRHAPPRSHRDGAAALRLLAARAGRAVWGEEGGAQGRRRPHSRLRVHRPRWAGGERQRVSRGGVASARGDCSGGGPRSRRRRDPAAQSQRARAPGRRAAAERGAGGARGDGGASRCARAAALRNRRAPACWHRVRHRGARCRPSRAAQPRAERCCARPLGLCRC